jgi:putative transposase
MPRTARAAPGGYVYHALNRAVARLPLFEKEADFEAFERVMEEAQQHHPTRIVAYCLIGTGHLYQGRFKSFPIQADEHYYTVLRYGS